MFEQKKPLRSTHHEPRRGNSNELLRALRRAARRPRTCSDVFARVRTLPRAARMFILAHPYTFVAVARFLRRACRGALRYRTLRQTPRTFYLAYKTGARILAVARLLCERHARGAHFIGTDQRQLAKPSGVARPNCYRCVIAKRALLPPHRLAQNQVYARASEQRHIIFLALSMHEATRCLRIFSSCIRNASMPRFDCEHVATPA